MMRCRNCGEELFEVYSGTGDPLRCVLPGGCLRCVALNFSILVDLLEFTREAPGRVWTQRELALLSNLAMTVERFRRRAGNVLEERGIRWPQGINEAWESGERG